MDWARTFWLSHSGLQAPAVFPLSAPRGSARVLRSVSTMGKRSRYRTFLIFGNRICNEEPWGWTTTWTDMLSHTNRRRGPGTGGRMFPFKDQNRSCPVFCYWCWKTYHQFVVVCKPAGPQFISSCSQSTQKQTLSKFYTESQPESERWVSVEVPLTYKWWDMRQPDTLFTHDQCTWVVMWSVFSGVRTDVGSNWHAAKTLTWTGLALVWKASRMDGALKTVTKPPTWIFF